MNHLQVPEKKIKQLNPVVSTTDTASGQMLLNANSKIPTFGTTAMSKFPYSETYREWVASLIAGQ